jgi:uncharacterized protein (DUF1800 family)
VTGVMVRRRAALLTGVLLLASLTVGQAETRVKTTGRAAGLTLPVSPLSEDEQILHALNRLGYGPRPSDPARVKTVGLATYVEGQLHPDPAPPPAMSEALAKYPVLGATTAQLLRDYPRRGADVQRRVASGEVTRRELREMFPADRRPAAIVAQMQAALVARAVLSDAQLEERLAQFWFNHFNVFSQKGAVRWMVPAYEREAIRPHVLGSFRDLVLATARHPAMLFYLDNWMSTRADPVMPRRPNSPASALPRLAGRATGLNENYARELMELHTLGVDGGYTQADVTAFAALFSTTLDEPFSARAVTPTDLRDRLRIRRGQPANRKAACCSEHWWKECFHTGSANSPRRPWIALRRTSLRENPGCLYRNS